MMAIQYMIGQLNSPIQQLIGFVQAAQDAHLSMERINVIHEEQEEEPEGKSFVYTLPKNKDIEIQNLSFTYPGAGNNPVLKGINLSIPEGKTTAIVGVSGSGKTTLVKLLLRFYQLDGGNIKVGAMPLNSISPRVWRSNCGVVMQDGFVFPTASRET